MPFVSKKQERFFNANRKSLEKKGVNVDEWNQASKGLNLPNKAGDPPMKKKKWMQGATEDIAKRGTKGSFRKMAEKAGKSTREYAEEKKSAPGLVGKRARLALVFLKAKRSK